MIFWNCCWEGSNINNYSVRCQPEGAPGVPPDPLAPRRGPTWARSRLPDRESAIGNAPALSTIVPGPVLWLACETYGWPMRGSPQAESDDDIFSTTTAPPHGPLKTARTIMACVLSPPGAARDAGGHGPAAPEDALSARHGNHLDVGHASHQPWMLALLATIPC